MSDAYTRWLKKARLYATVRRGHLVAQVEKSIGVIGEFLTLANNPYIAFSTGKDSSVLLHLVHQVDDSIPVVWLNDNWSMPGTTELIEQVEQAYSIRVLRATLLEGCVDFYNEFGFYPRCSRPLPCDIETDRQESIVEYFSFDGVFLGMRKQENYYRRIVLSKFGQIYFTQSTDKIWKCNPVADWSHNDIWAYMVDHDIPVHTAYRDLINAGVKPHLARVGNLTASRVYQYGSLQTARQIWPGFYNRFIADNPEIAGHG